ncbi:T9SS type A sorting domain-containing protein [Gelatiniphilus marinus]|uniref:T9SS type A sorting domain-containing protein n=1 Tax=Gelatiniphilus marinus TaxID=1759464 RepID=A0ABW5JSN3_9FLAO
MKNFIIPIVFILFINFSFSQNKDQIPEPDIDLMLENIDKSELTSSFLYDRTTPIANLTRFNTKDKNTASLGYFEQALQELYRASNKTKFKPIKEVRKYYKRKKSLNTIDIGVLHVMLQSLNYNSKDETLGALRFKDNQLTRINDNPVFLEHDVLVVSPLLDYAVGNTINYRFNPNLWFEDGENKITSIVANFGTGKDYLVYSKNKYTHREVSVNYAESGYKTLKFTVNYSDGEVKTTYGKLHVKLSETTQFRMMDPLVEDVTGFVSTHPFQGYDENAPVYGQIDYRIFYHTNNGNTQPTLLKPIVVIDGFDPGDIRKIQDEDSSKPPSEHLSIAEFMQYKDNNGQNIDLIDNLRNIGYDVVLVNHPTYTRGSKTIDGGADYIERNAMNHVTLYQHLNNKLVQNGSTEKLVIVGPSMGGQISRYALAYMEKNNMNHNTRLWVSVDSPHLGANIPMGIQSMINLLDAFGGSVAANDFYYNQLKSTAANQQLIEQHRIGHLPDYLNGGSPIHQQYYNNMSSNGLPNSNGYPQNLRKIAIVNGALNGAKVGVEGQEDFRIHGFADQIIGDIKVSEMNTKYMGNTGNVVQVARLWRLSKPLRTATYTNNNPHGSMDNVPGGLFNSEDLLHASVLGEGLDLLDDIYGFGDGVQFLDPFNLILGSLLGIYGSHFESRTNKKVHSFIPTVSALGFKNPNFNWSQRIDRNLVCTNEIPFDSYFGPKINERHTSFTEASVNWLKAELSGNPQSPSFPISPDKLLGEDYICNAETFTFDSCSTPEGVQNWEVSSNLQILSSTTNAVTVKPNVSYPANGWIKATFNASSSLTKNIQLNNTLLNTNDFNLTDEYYNAVSGSGSFNDPFLVCPNSSYILGYSGNSVVDLSTMSNVILPYGWSGYSYGALELLFTPGNFYGNPERIDISYQGECGNALHSVYFAEDSFNCSGGWFSYRVAPNPAVSDELSIVNIENEDTIKRIKPNAKVEFLLYNDQSILKKQKREKGNKKEYKLDISKLKNGFYYLKIIREEKTETHKVVIYR